MYIFSPILNQTKQHKKPPIIDHSKNKNSKTSFERQDRLLSLSIKSVLRRFRNQNIYYLINLSYLLRQNFVKERERMLVVTQCKNPENYKYFNTSR